MISPIPKLVIGPAPEQRFIFSLLCMETIAPRRKSRTKYGETEDFMGVHWGCYIGNSEGCYLLSMIPCDQSKVYLEQRPTWAYQARLAEVRGWK